MSNFEYKVNKASTDNIALHLSKCNNNFDPPLEQKVNIVEYSKKLASLSITFEAWVMEELVGLIAAYFNDEQSRKGYITDVSVVAEYGGNGFASTLMLNCIEYAKSNGFCEIGLEVNRTNWKAIRLYEKFDFIAVGATIENIIMEREIKG